MDDFKLPPVGVQSRKEDRQRWARIWFNALVRFHEVQEPEKWSFDRQDVIDFLRSKLRTGMPAWKRLKIVEGLLLYGQMHPRACRQRLEPLRVKLQQLATAERLEEDEIPIEDVVGRIDPREADVLQTLRRQLRLEGKAYATEKAYAGKVKAFMAARALKNLADFDEVGDRDIEHHLTDLAVEKEVAPSTQNQAFFALLFLFEHVLKRDVGEIKATRSTREPRIPSVMSESEVVGVLGNLTGVYQVIAQLLYGCGMRISEALRIRIKDIDFDRRLIEVHKSKGGKSRLVPLPATLVDRLRREIHSRSLVHDQDTLRGEASVWLPHALDRKYPTAHRELKWQFLFASHKFSRDPRSGRRHRHHLHADTFAAHLRRAVQQAEIHKHVTSHTFRHSFATHLLKRGTDIRTIQELLGHADLKTTMIYTHVLNRKDMHVVSPLDQVRSNQAADPVQAPGVVEQGSARPVDGRTLGENIQQAEDEASGIAPLHGDGDAGASDVLAASTESEVRSRNFRVLPLSVGRPAPAGFAAKQDCFVSEHPVDHRWRSAWETVRSACMALVSPRAGPGVRRRGIL